MGMVKSEERSEPFIALKEARFLVAYKPSGMHSTPPSGRLGPGAPGTGSPIADGLSLAEWVAARHPATARVCGRGRGEGGILHRLDRDTSGLVLFALDDDAFAHFETQAASGAFSKRYRVSACADGSGLEGSKPVLLAPPGMDSVKWARTTVSERRIGAAELLPGAELLSQIGRASCRERV